MGYLHHPTLANTADPFSVVAYREQVLKKDLILPKCFPLGRFAHS